MIIRLESAEDTDGIRRVNIAAFRDHPHSQQTEHLIVDALREAGALEVSLVAESSGEVIGHIALSAAEIGAMPEGWRLLGPVAVLPERQGEGVGRALMEAGLAEMRARGAAGVVLVGDPAFYERFGFRRCPGVTCHGVPDEYVLCLTLSGETPSGEVTHHPAFFARTEAQP